MAARSYSEPSLLLKPRRRDFFKPALLVALLFHIFLLRLVDFRLAKPKARPEWLEVTLVTEASEKDPKEAHFRAPANSEGGGDLPHPQTGGLRQAPEGGRDRDLPHPQTGDFPRDRGPFQKGAANPPVETSPEPKPRLAEQKLDLTRLKQQVLEVGDLLAERMVEGSQGVKPIRALRTKRYLAAAYELAWQRKVEAVGTRHYPKEARSRRAAVLVSVWVRSDGRVLKIKILRSSGHEAIDRAVEQIVRLAEPFPPFPEELRREANVLEITRLWRFESGALRGE